jgi:hypothetical protein
MAEHSAYTLRARQELLDARRGTKRWWCLSRELLSQQARPQSRNALKSAGGGWVPEPGDKADLLATTFGSKNVLPQLATNEYSDIEVNPYKQRASRSLTKGNVAEDLAELDEHSGDGA